MQRKNRGREPAAVKAVWLYKKEMQPPARGNMPLAGGCLLYVGRITLQARPFFSGSSVKTKMSSTVVWKTFAMSMASFREGL